MIINHKLRFIFINTYKTTSNSIETFLTLRCDDHIGKIRQSYAHPIMCGKLNKAIEFGAKPSVSLTCHGSSSVDRNNRNAFNEGGNLKSQTETLKALCGYYPERAHTSPVYGIRKIQKYLLRRKTLESLPKNQVSKKTGVKTRQTATASRILATRPDKHSVRARMTTSPSTSELKRLTP